MKRVCRSVLVIVLALIMFSLNVYAYDNGREYTNEYTAYRDMIPKYDELMEYLYRSVVDGEFSIKVHAYEIKEEYIVPIFNDLVSFSPELFFLNSRFSYRYANRNGTDYVTEIYFYYNFQGRELRAAQQVFNEEVKYIASLVDPHMSEAEKALWVHDYMVSLYAYDRDLQVYDAYRIMTGEYGVCRAYSLAYSAVLEELGMKCTMVISNEMNHAWNLVQVDGKWYHVDLVYDDPGIDRPGRVSHEYFLLSDSEISERESGKHYGWATSLVCDEPYDGSAPWKGQSRQMTYLDGKWYYIDEEAKAVVRENWDGSDLETVYEFSNRWYTSGERKNSWVGVFSGLGTTDGKLILNTDREVIALDPKTGARASIYETDSADQLCGVTVHKDEIKCFVSYSVNGDENSRVDRFSIPKIDLVTEEIPSETLPEDLPFADVSVSHPYYLSIVKVHKAGLFNGVSANEFAPESHLTRAMFVTVLGRLCGVETAKYSTPMFSDVPGGEWYSAYVSWAASEGIVNGVGDGKFDPSGELTREQMYKIAAYCAVKLTGMDTVTAAELPFSDRDDISDWAYDSVKYCLEYGIIDYTDGEIDPGAKATRAEAADVIARLSKLINNHIKWRTVWESYQNLNRKKYLNISSTFHPCLTDRGTRSRSVICA